MQEEGRSMISSVFVDTARYRLAHPEGGCEYREPFWRDHCCHLPGFLNQLGLEVLREEVRRLRASAVRKDFLMECMDNSPRHMNTLGANYIHKLSSLIPMFHLDAHFRRFLTNVYGDRVRSPQTEVDQFVLNYLDREGDTHGAHFDDYPIAVVIAFDVPPPGAGGAVEYVPDAEDLRALDSGAVRRLRLEPGDAYVLKTDTSAHRVAPLTADVTRTVVNFVFSTESFVPRQTTPSASILYAR
jgi:hypothetical protein